MSKKQAVRPEFVVFLAILVACCYITWHIAKKHDDPVIVGAYNLGKQDGITSATQQFLTVCYKGANIRFKDEHNQTHNYVCVPASQRLKKGLLQVDSSPHPTIYF